MNTESTGKEQEIFQDTLGNTANAKSFESENASNEANDKSNHSIKQRGVNADRSDSLAQIQLTNHEQFNQITKLKKDLHYWQEKSVKLSIENQCVEFDLKKARKIKVLHSRDNKSLKEQTEQLEATNSEQKVAIEDLTSKYQQVKSENEALQKERSETKVPVKEPVNLEQEIVEKFNGLADYSQMMRMLYTLQSTFQQKQYQMMMNQQKMANGAATSSNTEYNGGEQPLTNGMTYMPQQPMMSPMGYVNQGMYQNGTTQQVINTSSTKNGSK
jgi:hypothetical protein